MLLSPNPPFPLGCCYSRKAAHCLTLDVPPSLPLQRSRCLPDTPPLKLLMASLLEALPCCWTKSQAALHSCMMRCTALLLQRCCEAPLTLCHMQACREAHAALDSCAIWSTALLLQRSWMPLE